MNSLIVLSFPHYEYRRRLTRIRVSIGPGAYFQSPGLLQLGSDRRYRQPYPTSAVSSDCCHQADRQNVFHPPSSTLNIFPKLRTASFCGKFPYVSSSVIQKLFWPQMKISKKFRASPSKHICEGQIWIDKWPLLLLSHYRQDAAKRQTAGIKFTHRPKIRFFRPAGATRCTDSGQIWQGQTFYLNRPRGWECGPKNIKKIPLLVKSRLAWANLLTNV